MDVDVDNEFDGKFLDQFRSMGTTDRDVLIAEFQAVLGNKLNPESCAFFLDMNNWNLQNAVCSYYDFEQPANSLPSMSITADVTIGDGEAVAPNTTFVKTWKIKNSGPDRWPPGCHLRFCSGNNLSTVERRMVEALSPGETMDVSVEMRSPSFNGSYLSIWRMSTPTGIYFGDVIHVHVVVAEGGLLSLTQQLSRIGGGFLVASDTASPGHMASSQDTSCGSMETTQQPQPPTSLFSGQLEVSQLPQSTDSSLTSPPNIEEDTEMS